MQCYECGTERGMLVQVVERWDPNGPRIVVPTCARHTVCRECSDIMEVNPISGRVECFPHGPVNDLIFISFTSVLNAWCTGYRRKRHYGPVNFPLTLRERTGEARFIFSAQKDYVLSGGVPMEVTWLNKEKDMCFDLVPEAEVDKPLLPLWRELRAHLVKADDEGRIRWGHQSPDYWKLADRLRDRGHDVPQFNLDVLRKEQA